MLTNDDLRKIGDLIDQRLEVKLEQKLEQKLAPIKGDILTIKDDISGLKENISGMKKDIKSLKNGQKRLRKDVTMMLKHFDGARADHEKRITRIEDHLSLQ